ncbi:MAG: paraquat-inducible protein A [Paracoccaceae bacterium]
MSVPAAVTTAREAGLVGCTTCAGAWPPSLAHCPRCAARLVSRPPSGLQPVWAWWIAGVILYVPANAWPMLITRQIGHNEQSTILGGALELAAMGSYGVAAIVIVASVVIPIAKFAAIAALAIAVHRGTPGRVGQRTTRRLVHLYEVVEFIGRWSMIDIFVVAILSALVQMGLVASISPGPAAGCFALSVAFTMLSARAFDPRLLWDAFGSAQSAEMRDEDAR